MKHFNQLIANLLLLAAVVVGVNHAKWVNPLTIAEVLISIYLLTSRAPVKVAGMNLLGLILAGGLFGTTLAALWQEGKASEAFSYVIGALGFLSLMIKVLELEGVFDERREQRLQRERVREQARIDRQQRNRQIRQRPTEREREGWNGLFDGIERNRTQGSNRRVTPPVKKPAAKPRKPRKKKEVLSKWDRILKDDDS